LFAIDSSAEVVSVNGSSLIGLCSNVTADVETGSDAVVCNTPTTSVLFDGIPTLSGLDGNMWARQLFTSNSGTVVYVFDFTMLSEYEGFTRIEVATFQCPEWGIGVSNIGIAVGDSLLQDLEIGQSEEVNTSLISSCESLVRVCIDINRESIEAVGPIAGLGFTALDFAHIGEVTFINDAGTSCPPDIIIQPDDMTGMYL
jgi:hypothetical protein